MLFICLVLFLMAMPPHPEEMKREHADAGEDEKRISCSA